MKNYPTLRQLQYYIALAETLSFSKAAERCFVTQSTLSAGIKELETIVGAQLVERSSRHVFLTPIGQYFLKAAHELLEQTDHILDHIQGAKDEPSGYLYVGIIPTIAPFYTRDFFENIAQAFPKITPILSEDQTEHVLEKLKSGQIDMGVIALPYTLEDLQSWTFKEDRFLLAAPPKLYEGKTISMDRLRDLPLVLLDDGHCLSDHAISSCQLPRSLKKQAHHIASIDTLLLLAMKNNAGTLVTEMMKPSIKRKQLSLKLINIEPEKPKRDLALIWRKNSFAEKLVQKLIP